LRSIKFNISWTSASIGSSIASAILFTQWLP
jgi:hypothetical protein